MNKRLIVILSAIVLLSGSSLWAYLHFRNRPDPQVQNVQRMMADPEMQKLSWQERREKIGQEMAKLTPQQREAARQAMRTRGEQRFQKQLDAYFAMSPQQKSDYLSQMITAGERFRAEREARRQQEAAAGNGSQGGPGGGPDSPQNRTQASSGTNSGGGPGQGDRTEQRLSRRADMLNQTTPEQRAQRTQFFQDLQAQRSAMGLPPMTGRGFGGGPGFFGGGPPPGR
jgi:hypothetical protein